MYTVDIPAINTHKPKLKVGEYTRYQNIRSHLYEKHAPNWI